MGSDGVRVVATLVAREGKAAELGAMLRGLVEPTNAEEGCRRYELWHNEADENEFRFIEEWDSEEALAAHFETPHITAGLGRLPELLAGELDVRKYRLLG